MLYLLLIIIAIGVLLASESGKELLNIILIFLGLVGIGYIGFWFIVLIIGFLSSDTFKNFINWAGSVWDGIILLSGFVIFLYFLNFLIKKTKFEINKRYPKVLPFLYKHKKIINNTSLIIFIILVSILLGVTIYNTP